MSNKLVAWLFVFRELFIISKYTFIYSESLQRFFFGGESIEVPIFWYKNSFSGKEG